MVVGGRCGGLGGLLHYIRVIATLHNADESWDPMPAPQVCLYAVPQAVKMQVSLAARCEECFGSRWCVVQNEVLFYV